MAGTITAVCLRRIPHGLPTADDFELCQRPRPRVGTGDLHLRVRWLSIDPFLRAQLSGRYAEPCPLPGAIVPGLGLGTVIEDRSGRFAPGEWVSGPTGWTSEAVFDAARALPAATGTLPPRAALGVLGIPGLTAWAGVRRILEPEAGETVLVSTAAGAVGSVAGQLCKAAGARVVGLSSSAEKCAAVVAEFGFDVCLDYRAADFPARLRAACPEGIDGYFDNVGGPVLEAALGVLRHGARVVLCGLSSQYGLSTPPPGPNLGPVIAARARLQGLVVFDHLGELQQCRQELGALISAGRLHAREHVHQGLDQAPAAFIGMLAGANTGKTLVDLDAPA